MGNPRPTKSKPIKIGRKHTGAKSLRKVGRLTSGAKKNQFKENSKWNKFKKQVAAYWRGELENYPQPPSSI